MAQLTKAAFADKCNMATNELAVYIKRKKVFVENDLIDTLNETNRVFYEKKTKKKAEAAPEDTPGTDTNRPTAKSSVSDLPEYIDSERKLKYLDTLKREKDIERQQIEIEKSRGLLIPTEVVKVLFSVHTRSIVQSLRSQFETLTDNLIVKYGLNNDDSVAIRKGTMEAINQAVEGSITDSKKSLENVVSEYTETIKITEKPTETPELS